MTYSTFALILLLSYGLYYGLNLLFDLVIHGSKAPAESSPEVMFFQEHSQPELIEYQGPSSVPEPDTHSAAVATSVSGSPALEYTGGLSLQELYRRAKDGLIEFTKAIPY